MLWIDINSFLWTYIPACECLQRTPDESKKMIFSFSLLLGSALVGSIADYPVDPAAHYPNHADLQLLSQRGSTVYIDHQCRTTAESWMNAWRVAHRQSFTAQGQDYWLVLGKYGDGSSLLCITKPGFQSGWKLYAPRLQRQFIGDIQKEVAASFQVIVNSGNGRIVNLERYSLNLSNPKSPQLSTIESWSGEPILNPIMR